ncbi:monovalent cation/H(+) antiporter subunit G [Phycisphaera mikurensis]|uniref:Na(+)/H(+) antiporter subunit G n=1 Tax=Phycisphaera mikurensis (strain NBRC 102666 / KCTC 22515 / FYK2301M01) TaxID=1142394 RepID=I0IC26_PHYMF|nr:monovalent cation/H(+) antiporter subunit G [Phycisphaera mikurensis]MBB6441962.1 multicomponent Na+:H+ antiporter subunit G [Phycisphaera mikurensis]BAM02814.1 Na(+)/H(+) antiporter subunit G [Phycisphaera mikurensis NBRC 102666]
MPAECLNVLEYAALGLGVALCLLAGVGILRMPDVYTRMQASTKAGTLGIGLIMVSVALHFRDAVTGLQAALVIAFLFLTAPVASHLISRAAHALGASMWDRSVIDEMPATASTPTDPRKPDPNPHERG